ncbi:MAG TPA: hypothetical protein VGO62_14310, partial [Myxococcota bacterium]
LPAWFDVNAQRRQSLGFCDVGAPSEAVTDLPVTVILTPDIFDFATAQPDGSDVFFVDGSDEQPLPFQKAQFQPTGTAPFAVFFVRVPSFNPHTQTDALWMYWDQIAPVSREDIAATWSGHLAVWHMDSVPVNADGSSLQIASASSVVDTVSGAIALNAFASAANNNQGAFVFGALGLLGHSALFDAGGVGCGAGCQADSFMVLPVPAGLTSDVGSISVVAGSITDSNGDGSQTRSGFGGGGCANGSADCGHLWLLGERAGSTGFDAKSLHVTTFEAGRVGVSRPSNPSTAGNFSATSDTAVISQDAFSVVSATWSASSIDVTVTVADGATVDQTVITSARAGVSIPISNFALAVSENTSRFDQAGDLFGSLEEIRVSGVTRSPAFVRAEAAAHLGELFVFGAEETVP